MLEHPYKHSYKFPQRILASLAVYNTGIQKCQSNYSWGPGVRDHYLLHYVMAGRGEYQVDGRTYALCAGDLFLACPDVNIFYKSDAEEPWEYCWVGFHGTDAPLLLARTDLSRETPVCTIEGEDLYKQMMLIYQFKGSLEHQTTYMTGALYQLLSILMRTRRSSAKRSPSIHHVARACDFIANNFALPISIEDVAAHVGISRSRLYRAFAREIQLSPVQYLSNFRIRQACALLQRRSLSIKAVAQSVGFENQLYFSRRFRQIMQMSPTEFIRALDERPVVDEGYLQS